MKQATEREDIGGSRPRRAGYAALGRREAVPATDALRPGGAVGRKRLECAVVDDFYAIVLIDQNVSGVQIAVEVLRRVDVSQAARDLRENRARAPDRHRFAPEKILAAGELDD